jgi:hypothetical protein
VSTSHRLAQYPIFNFRNLINSGNINLFVFPFRSHDTIVNIMTRLRAGSSRVQNRANERDLSVQRNVQTGSGVHSAFCSLGRGFLSRGGGKRRWRLKMSGAIPLLPPYAFRAWTGTTLHVFVVLSRALSVAQYRSVEC